MRIFDRLAKRAGVYVSRPVLNGDAWVKWAEKFGVPSPVEADKMHVTILASRKDVKVRPQIGEHQVFTTQGHVTKLGLEADVLVFAWSCDWMLSDRHYTLREFGGTSDWPDYRPHITLSYSAKDFELPDEALAAMPPSFLLGPEIHAPFDPSPNLKKEAPEDVLQIEDIAVAKARDFVEGVVAKRQDRGALSVDELQTLTLIGSGVPVRKSALEAIEGKVAFLSAPQHTGIFKRDEECRMVYGFASVSLTEKGHVVDSHEDMITTKALRSLCHGLVKTSRAGKFDHKGMKKSDIVEAMVFDADVWRGMGEYFEAMGVLTPEQASVFKGMKFEGLLAGFHCPDDEVWAIAKDTEFELSIGAEIAYVEDIDNG